MLKGSCLNNTSWLYLLPHGGILHSSRGAWASGSIGALLDLVIAYGGVKAEAFAEE
jgi:hypothetical protein